MWDMGHSGTPGTINKSIIKECKFRNRLKDAFYLDQSIQEVYNINYFSHNQLKQSLIRKI